MVDHSAGDDREASDVSRRALVTRLLGAAVGATSLAACTQDAEGADWMGTAVSALAADFVGVWVDTVLGSFPESADIARTGTLATKTPAELQTTFGLDAAPTVVIAKGCVFAGDGGGGIFIWDPDASKKDDGGTRIVPHGNIGTVGAGWKRVWSERINIRWFGVPAAWDASKSSHYAVQKAFDASKDLNEQSLSVSSTVYFPRGSYFFSDSVDTYGLAVWGDQASIAPSGTTTPAAFLRIPQTRGSVTGLSFSSNANSKPQTHIVIYGSGINNAQITISDCRFNDPSDCAIVMQDFSGIHLVVERFVFSGPRFFRGALDNLCVRAGFVEWVLQAADPANLYKNYCFDIVGNALLEDVTGAPGVPSDTDELAWIRINGGHLSCRNFRFGGENGGAPIVHVMSRDTASPPVTMTSPTRSNVDFVDCALYCSPGIVYRHWLKIFDIFPWSLRVNGMPRNGLDSSSILVVGANALASLYLTHDVEIEFDQQMYQRGSAATFFSDQGGAILNGERLAAFERRSYEPIAELGQDNLYPWVGVYEPRQTALYGTSASVVRLWVNDPTAVEDFHGRALPIFQVSAGTVRGTITDASPAFTSLPAGTYCYSFFIKCSSPVEIIVSYAGFAIRKVYVPATGTGFRRVYATFWHDGSSGRQVQFAIGQIAPGARVSYGFYAVHAGHQPAPYTLPGNTVRADGKNVLPEAYYGTSAPSGGTYKVGDIVYNVNPGAAAPNNVIGWVCTAAPNIWKAFGQVLP
jgi:hypothetical protein